MIVATVIRRFRAPNGERAAPLELSRDLELLAVPVSGTLLVFADGSTVLVATVALAHG